MKSAYIMHVISFNILYYIITFYYNPLRPPLLALASGKTERLRGGNTILSLLASLPSPFSASLSMPPTFGCLLRLLRGCH